MNEKIKIGVIGLGEAGSLIAQGLQVAGAHVLGFDPLKLDASEVLRASGVTGAVEGADVVFSINSATAARGVAEQVAPLLGASSVFADLNTGTPALKKSIAALFPEGAFVDVALMKPVPGLAEKVPMAVAGGGARRLMEMLAPFGMNLEYVSDVPGEAAARKLLRSILAKGIAGVVIDCLWAAESMGLQDWSYEEILREFDSTSAETARRYLTGTARHLKRRQIEMMDVTEMLDDIGYQSTMIDGVALTYSRILHGRKIPFSK